MKDLDFVCLFENVFFFMIDMMVRFYIDGKDEKIKKKF